MLLLLLFWKVVVASAPPPKKKHFLVLGVPDVVNIPLRSLWAPVSLGGL